MTTHFHQQPPLQIRLQCTVVAPACAALTMESPQLASFHREVARALRSRAFDAERSAAVRSIARRHP